MKTSEMQRANDVCWSKKPLVVAETWASAGLDLRSSFARPPSSDFCSNASVSSSQGLAAAIVVGELLEAGLRLDCQRPDGRQRVAEGGERRLRLLERRRQLLDRQREVRRLGGEGARERVEVGDEVGEVVLARRRACRRWCRSS